MNVKAVDVFITSATLPKFENLADWSCTVVFNRGTRVGPVGKISCHMTDVFQCRFVYAKGVTDSGQVLKLLEALHEKKIMWSNVHMIWE